MNRKTMPPARAAMFAASLLLAVLTPSVAQAQASSLWETFNSNALPAALEESGLSPTYAGGVVTFPGGSDSSRRYLRTIGNYNATSFIAEVTVTVASASGGADMAFIGFGAGVPNSGFFYEPMFAPSIYARIAADSFGDGFVAITNGPVENIQSTPFAAGDGTHRVRISWTDTAQVFTFEIHRNYTGGPFVPSTTIGPVVVTDLFGATNSRIFFGGAGNVTFDDLLVFTGFAGTPGAKNCHGKSVSALAQLFGGIENAVSALGYPSVAALQETIKESCRIE